MTCKLDFVRLCGEAERLRHTYDAGCRNILRFEVGRHINNRVENSHLLFRRRERVML